MGKSWYPPIFIGLIGATILMALGLWQMQRLDWKTGVLAQIDARLTEAPAILPETPDAAVDRFAPVKLDGQADVRELHVLVSHKQLGAGFKIITAFTDASGRRVLLDQGFVPVSQKDTSRARLSGPVLGNLHWPDGRNSSTPDNDVEANMWFARDLEQMAAQLGTEPVLVILRQAPGLDPSVTPLPLDSATIPNDHLIYAITWFLLAASWLGMTAFWLWRIRQRTI